LVGFDTPETGLRAKCEAERTLAHKATQRLRNLVAQGALDLVEVRCSCPPSTEGTRRCNYGRSCGVLTSRKTDVGAILMNEKLARPYVCGPMHCPRRESWCS
jgi:endonuclease YncB( thermonuclease family)